MFVFSLSKEKQKVIVLIVSIVSKPTSCLNHTNTPTVISSNFQTSNYINCTESINSVHTVNNCTCMSVHFYNIMPTFVN